MAALRSDELVARLRQSAYIQDANAWPEYTEQKLLDELNDKLRSVFPKLFVGARGGFWLKESNLTCTVGRQRYRIPARSCAAGLEKVEIADIGSQKFSRLTQLPASEAQDYDYGAPNTGGPRWYTIQGDQVEIIPAPDAAYPLKFSFYMRPSLLCRSQSSTLVGAGDAVDRGRITAVNTVARTVTVAGALPFDQLLAVPAAITSANQLIDIVHPNGSCELSMWGQSQTIAGLVITLGGTDDMTDVAVGDYVRVAEQTDWAPIPEDYQRCLADRAAMAVLMELTLDEKAASLGSSVGADLERLEALINPRVKSEPKRIPLMSFTRGAAPAWRRF